MHVYLCPREAALQAGEDALEEQLVSLSCRDYVHFDFSGRMMIPLPEGLLRVGSMTSGWRRKSSAIIMMTRRNGSGHSATRLKFTPADDHHMTKAYSIGPIGSSHRW